MWETIELKHTDPNIKKIQPNYFFRASLPYCPTYYDNCEVVYQVEVASFAPVSRCVLGKNDKLYRFDWPWLHFLFHSAIILERNEFRQSVLDLIGVLYASDVPIPDVNTPIIFKRPTMFSGQGVATGNLNFGDVCFGVATIHVINLSSFVHYFWNTAFEGHNLDLAFAEMANPRTLQKIASSHFRGVKLELVQP